MPLGLSFIASIVRQEGHEVRIFDRFSQMARLGSRTGLINEAMLRSIKEFRPDVIGLNTVSPLIYDSVQCVQITRQDYRGLVLAGGHHATALPELTLRKMPGLDGIVQGEGEVPMLQLLKGDSPQTIAGIWWRGADDRVTHVPPQQIADLDAPFPQPEPAGFALLHQAECAADPRTLSVIHLIDNLTGL